MFHSYLAGLSTCLYFIILRFGVRPANVGTVSTASRDVQGYVQPLWVLCSTFGVNELRTQILRTPRGSQ